MKKSSFILFMFLTFGALAQQNNNSTLIDKIFLALPDSIMLSDFYELNYGKRDTLLNLLRQENRDEIYYKHDISFNIYNEDGNFIKMVQPRSDAMATCEIKVFCESNDSIVAITFRNYDYATTASERTVFYDYSNGKFNDVSKKIFKSFHYYTDNYGSNTIDSLNQYFKTDLRENPVHNYMLYKFTKSDTVYIIQNFYDYFLNFDDPGLDTTYFDGEFYTKKYIMENGKLRLAE